MPCNDCSRTETCPPCPYEEVEKPECEHPNKLYTGSVYNGPAGRKTFLFYTCPDCKAHLKEEEVDEVESRCTCGSDEVCGDPCTSAAEEHELKPKPSDSRCFLCPDEACGDCPETPEEPPLTPEEEEMVSGYEELAEQAAKPPPMDPVHILGAEAPAPPQPDRRPPYLLAYSVQGHLYEVALPGDAIVAALDGRLVITHSLGPVAGICQVAPITSEESTR